MTSLTSTKTTKSTNENFDEKTHFKYLFSQSNDVQPFLRASLFDNVPPTILFYVKGTKGFFSLFFFIFLRIDKKLTDIFLREDGEV